jgi:GAF domain-containing protein
VGLSIDRHLLHEETLRLKAVARTGLANQADETMDRLAALVARILGSAVGLVSLVDDVRQFFPGQVGLTSPWSEVRETPLSQSLCRMVVSTGVVVQIDSVETDARTFQHQARTVFGVESYLGAPLFDVDGRVLGSLCAIERTARAWTADECQILADLAFGAASALRARIAVSEAEIAKSIADFAKSEAEAAKSIADLAKSEAEAAKSIADLAKSEAEAAKSIADLAKSEAEAAKSIAEIAQKRVQLMADVSSALISTMDPDWSIRRMLDTLVAEYVGWAMVFIRADGEYGERLFVRHHSSDVNDVLMAMSADGSRRLRDMGLTREVLDGDVAHVMLTAVEARDAVMLESESSSDLLLKLGIGSAIAVPMTRAGGAIGALVLIGDPGRQDFDEVDLLLAGDLARRAAMVFDHARLYIREKRVASELQHSLLPDLPDVEQLDIGAVYTAASDGIEVGGDWYDLVHVGDGSFVASVGDVTGHSIRAAAAMGRLQVVLRIFAASSAGPGEMLDRAADEAPALLAGLLATCAIVRLDPRPDSAWTATFANAGHLPPLLIDADGNASLIHLINDPLLGLTSARRRRHTETTITMTAGSTLVLYTDGLVERREEGLDISLERLRATASMSTQGVTMKRFCHDLVQRVVPSGMDDVAVIAIRV